MIAKATAKARSFPGSLDAARLANIRTFRDFDEAVTAPLHGFASTEDYWARASSLPHLNHIALPDLLLNALNNPLLDEPSFPWQEARANDQLHLETPAHGGHVGFPDPAHNWQPWYARRALQFLSGTMLL